MNDGGRTLLVASTGGHLVELHRLQERFFPSSQAVEWATFDDPQSRSLLGSTSDIHLVPYISPRAYGAATHALPLARQILRRGGFSRVVSTGSGIAFPFLSMARSLGLQAHYIESAARTHGPSRTGWLLSRIPGIRLYSQHRAWARGRWGYAGSLFDGYQPHARVDPPVEARRVVVTLGTMRDYGFRSAVQRLSKILPEVLAPNAEVLWQVGGTDVDGLGIRVHQLLPAHELAAAIAAADLVIAHAGIGSALSALDAGHSPVLLPRRGARCEHVDDHQVLIADRLAERRLVVVRDAERVNAADLRLSMSSEVRVEARQKCFKLH